MGNVPWSVTHAPGAMPQEGAGKLINVFAERRGDEQAIVWRRAPGCTVFTHEPSAGSAAGGATAIAISHIVEAAGAARGAGTGTAVGAA